MKFFACRPKLFQIRDPIAAEWQLETPPAVGVLDARHVTLHIGSAVDTNQALARDSNKMNTSMFSLFRWSKESTIVLSGLNSIICHYITTTKRLCINWVPCSKSCLEFIHPLLHWQTKYLRKYVSRWTLPSHSWTPCGSELPRSMVGKSTRNILAIILIVLIAVCLVTP